jgi:hypothetical protein
MAWCPHCSEDRPIKRLVEGAGTDNPQGVDTCQFCHTRVFATARNSEEYGDAARSAVEEEQRALQESLKRAEREAKAKKLETILAFVGLAVFGIFILFISKSLWWTPSPPTRETYDEPEEDDDQIRVDREEGAVLVAMERARVAYEKGDETGDAFFVERGDKVVVVKVTWGGDLQVRIQTGRDENGEGYIVDLSLFEDVAEDED